MARCFFCGEKMPPGRGKVLVKSDGRIFYFDRPKCERNFKLGREGPRVKWTSLARKAGKKGK
jgi:large subunit ribosomal protein L24e